ncbi:hypothetical protein Tco_1383647 [Tanacetum coccineum]
MVIFNDGGKIKDNFMDDLGFIGIDLVIFDEGYGGFCGCSRRTVGRGEDTSGNDMHCEELMALNDYFDAGILVDIVVDDEMFHKLISIVEKNELFEELMIAVVDTEQNLAEFDS